MPYLYKLKLLNGPLSGRELKLREGTLTLGSGEYADISLALEGGMTELVLDANAEGVKVSQPIMAWVGEELVLSLETLPLGQPMELAGVGLVLGHVNDDLSEFNSWSRPEKTASRTSILLNSILFGALLLLTAGAIFWILNSNDSQQIPVDMHKFVDEYAKQRSLEEVGFLWLPDGSLQISGWCSHESDIAPLLAELRKQQILYHSQAVCQDKLLKNVGYAIGLYGYEQVQVEPGESHGSVVINGAIQDDARWQQVVTLLSTMPGLKKWNVVNQSDSEVGKLIQQLRKSRLLSKLSVKRSNRRVVVSGKLSDSEVTKLSNVMKNYVLANPDAMQIVFQNIQAINADSGVLPAPIVSVGGNEQSPYLELSNGMRLQKGAQLPSGYVIRNIDSVNGIELSLHGQLVHIPLGF